MHDDLLTSKLRQVAPNAIFVADHIMRRAVRIERHLTNVRAVVPHIHSLSLSLQSAREAAPSEDLLSLPPDCKWVIFLARPEKKPLLESWRRLFHAKMDEAFNEKWASGEINQDFIKQVLEQAGPLSMDEVKAILIEEDLISGASPDPNEDEQKLLFYEVMELMSLYAEIRFFSPHLLSHTFPSLTQNKALLETFEGIIDAETLFQETRLEGAPHPESLKLIPASKPLPEWRMKQLFQSTHRAKRHHRYVDMALSAWHLIQIVPAAKQTHFASKNLLDEAILCLAKKLCDLEAQSLIEAPLTKALQVSPAKGAPITSRQPRITSKHPKMEARASLEQAWANTIYALMPFAADGAKSMAGRLLYDLERACDTQSEAPVSIDLGRALRSFFRRPIKMTEKTHQRIKVTRHIIRAEKRLSTIPLPQEAREVATLAFSRLSSAWEALVRNDVDGILNAAFTEAGLIPNAIPEEVARQKLISELSDQLLSRGFLAFSDLRDSIAQNQLKLRDANPFWALFRRDALLSLDRLLKRKLGSAYQPAELYRRFFHRVAALLFSNAPGRLLVKQLFIPFGGAFVALKGIDLVVLSLIASILGIQPSPPPPGSPEGTLPEHALQIFSLPLLIIVGTFLLFLLNSPWLRKNTFLLLRSLKRLSKRLLKEIPKLVSNLSWVKWLRATSAFKFFHDHLWRPCIYAFPFTFIFVLAFKNEGLWLSLGLPLWLALSLVLGTKRGKRWADTARDATLSGLRNLVRNLIPGLISALMEGFKTTIDGIETLFYVVDQKLRYREVKTGRETAIVAVFGLLWGILSYFSRLIINLIAEPQLNPIKHFPVVSVAHKVTIPWSFAVHGHLKDIGLSEATASLLGLGAFQLAVPGLAGYLVWEFKETWRLYGANRSPALRPVPIGAHGESLARLLRPGFHSGTIPKLFRKVRKADTKGNPLSARKFLRELHHNELLIQRFIERELLAYLKHFHLDDPGRELEVSHVGLTRSRIHIELSQRAYPEKALHLSFEERGGLLVGAIIDPSDLVLSMPENEEERLELGILGLYQLAHIDLLRAALDDALGGHPYTISEGKLISEWDKESRFSYPIDLQESLWFPNEGGPPLETRHFSLKPVKITWEEWCLSWENKHARKELLKSVRNERSILKGSPLASLRSEVTESH